MVLLFMVAPLLALPRRPVAEPPPLPEKLPATGGAHPAGVLPAGILPAGILPATGALPAGALPAGALPATGALPAKGGHPAGALPAGALPTGALPTGTLPSGALPTGALPTGALPAGGLRPDGTPRLPKGSLPDKPDKPVGGTPRSLLDGEGGAMHAWYCGQPGNEAALPCLMQQLHALPKVSYPYPSPPP